MYYIKEKDWGKYNNISHEQRYFIYQWSKLLSIKTLELERISLIGLRGKLEEILNIFKLCDDNIINEEHLANLAKEINDLLKENLVIKKII
jgi:hypothetical protein